MKNRSYTILSGILGLLAGVALMLTVQKVNENRGLLRTEYRDWRKLNLVLEKVGEMYVDTIDNKTLTDAAITAVLAKLDPHSIYMPPVELEESEEDLSGGFDGIGIQFNVPNDTAVVIEVIPGGPSEKIGLRPGDRLLKVDDKVIAGVKFPQDSMVRRMKGPAGTKVQITVRRGGEDICFDITRGKIPTWSVDAAFMTDDTTGYIRLSKFSRTTVDEFSAKSKELLEQGMKHLVVDLRDNTGGYLDQAYSLSNLFLPRDTMVVYMEGLHRRREELRADGRGFLQDVKLSVLINENSASSSEIFAGAMQDNGRGTIVGRRSFGKGLVQEPLFFTDGSGIRITVARFYTPSGRCIQKPYEDYDYELYRRYTGGEMMDADSMKLEKGGILPDIFVALDTTSASKFYIDCNRKATSLRFASAWFDTHSEELSVIDNFDTLLRYFEQNRLEEHFLEYARSKDGLVPSAGEWAKSREYMMPVVRALVGRYSKLGDNAFYHLYLQIDDTFAAATAQ